MDASLPNILKNSEMLKKKKSIKFYFLLEDKQIFHTKILFKHLIINEIKSRQNL